MCPPRRHHVTGGKVLNFSITLSPAHVNISNVFLVWTIVSSVISLFSPSRHARKDRRNTLSSP